MKHSGVETLFAKDSDDDARLEIGFYKVGFANKLRRVRDGSQTPDILYCRGDYGCRNIEVESKLMLLESQDTGCLDFRFWK